jgi:glycosyltransferase involved in cell wall biosynthesis
MRVSVVVTSYNYKKFIIEAIESVLNQSRSVDELIVVDDGSNDGSLEEIRNNFGSHPLIKIFSKPNGGQLSAFNVGFLEAKGDIIFFLDSDDSYRLDYIEKSLGFYTDHPNCDFLFCAFEEFGDGERVVKKHPRSRDMGFSLIDVLHKETWIGGPTSTLSVRKTVLDKFMPLPFEVDWRVCADNCLVWGASLAGAHKYFLDEPLVRYRLHGENAHTRLKLTGDYVFHLKLKSNCLFNYLIKKFGYLEKNLIEFVDKEVFSSSEKPTLSEVIKYVKIIFKANHCLYWKVGKVFKIFNIYFFNFENRN